MYYFCYYLIISQDWLQKISYVVDIDIYVPSSICITNTYFSF